ncbi:polysaccharide pyruvyl transferase family protein [Metabacillus sp. FJAT-52054]|uniref:Polysaccharide pyruvyl transferase family protein n=1 Tax=Metabacillus sediminis TaxID=3117746 RepID=A0ABZ2NHK7_9BACI
MNSVKKVFKRVPYMQKGIALVRKKEYDIKNYKRVSNNINHQRGENNQPIIYLFACPRHRNLGDHAIVLAEKKLIKDLCPVYKVIDIYLDDTFIAAKEIRKQIKENDIIAFNGGGYIGDEYLHAEKAIRYLLGLFNDNKCLFFPQTIFFSNTERGRIEFNKTIEEYSKHPNLLLVARENKSYNIIKQNFTKNKVILAPDIVFYLNESKENIVRNNILTCLRDDVESSLSVSEKNGIISELKKKYNNVKITDTLSSENVSSSEREESLKQKLDEFRSSKIVVTDRIHGMIFAAITETPCIVLNNYNHKVKGTHEWIKNLNYIKFVENKDDLFKLVEDLQGLKTDKFDNNFALKYHKEICNFINS